MFHTPKKEGHMNYRRTLLVVVSVVVALLLVAPTTMVRAGSNPNPGVLPPNSHPGGLTYAQWGARWWQWALSIPYPTNPLFDTPGADCSAGQSNDVWFLGGEFGAQRAVSRACTVPTGTMLFFPIADSECDTTPPIAPYTPDQFLALCPSLLTPMTTIGNVTARVDGRSLQDLQTNCPQVQGSQIIQAKPSYCVGGGPFPLTLPANNAYTSTGGDVPAGTYEEVHEGMYVMLAPLSAGSHTIHFTYSFPALPPTAPADVTYHLTITS
jgi:hypothetical protein